MTKKKSHPQSQPSGSDEQSLVTRLAEGSHQISRALSERQIIQVLFDQLKQLEPSELALFQYKMVRDQPLWANLRAGWQTPFPADIELYLPDSPLQKLLTSPAPLFIPDVSADSRLSRPEISALAEHGIRSAAFLPLTCGGHSFGVVMAGYTQPFAFDPPARQIFTLLTNQAGASLVNQLFIQKSAYRAVQMDAAAKIAQAVGDIHSLQELLDSSVELLCTHFDLHYAGVFLIDDTGQWAELRAGSGEAGRRQLQEGHRLKLDDSSMVGWAITHGQARIALDVGDDAVHFRNPYLPDTRSEMALPLRYHNQILGALTIQSTEPAAFSQEDIAFLQIIADQLAVGVKNARLFAELAERETQNTVLLEAIPDLLFRINREGVFVAVKGSEETPTMIPLDEIPGKSLFDIFPPDFAQTRYEDIQRCLETGQPQHFEYSLPIEGDVGYFEARMVRSGEDEVLAIIRNITERKKAELALKHSEARYRELIESANSIVLRLNARGEVLFINRFAQEFFGYSEDEIIGKNVVGTIVPENDMADRELRQLLEDLLKNPDQYSTNVNENMCRDGRIVWVSWSNRAIRDEAGQVSEILCIGNDVTALRRTEENMRDVLRRTELLRNISNTLMTIQDEHTIFRKTLAGYLQLVNVPRGSITLIDRARNTNRLATVLMDGQALRSNIIFPTTEDPVSLHIIQHPEPLVIPNVTTHPLTRKHQQIDSYTRSLLVIPIIIQGEVAGLISASSPEEGHPFSDGDIRTGQAIAGQLAVWLENRRLTMQTQHRFKLLQTAAEVSRAASSILDPDELIQTSVNLIRDHFDFYYVGLFLVDEAGEWAVLQAGTGEAGRRQVEAGHRLKIGGESMIGWSIANRRARIALDVGEEAVHFRNPYLPDTHSEMALPLISRDRVIGALTVQSTERAAFSDEDITVLQTMADQLANAIANARLFEAAESRLRETEAMQKYSAALAGVLHTNEVVDVFLGACTSVIGFDYAVVSLIFPDQHRVMPVGGVGVSDSYLKRMAESLDGPGILADIIRTGATEIITGWDDRLNEKLYEDENQATWTRVFTPIKLRGQHVGVVEAGYNRAERTEISRGQLRLLRAFIDQGAVAFDNARRYEASQRAARREALIKDITTRVRSTTDIHRILETAVQEIGQALESRRAFIHLSARPGSDRQKTNEHEGNGNE